MIRGIIMKKILVLLGVLLIGSCSFADEIMVIQGANLNKF